MGTRKITTECGCEIEVVLDSSEARCFVAERSTIRVTASSVRSRNAVVSSANAVYRGSRCRFAPSEHTVSLGNRQSVACLYLFLCNLTPGRGILAALTSWQPRMLLVLSDASCLYVSFI